MLAAQEKPEQEAKKPRKRSSASSLTPTVFRHLDELLVYNRPDNSTLDRLATAILNIPPHQSSSDNLGSLLSTLEATEESTAREWKIATQELRWAKKHAHELATGITTDTSLDKTPPIAPYDQNIVDWYLTLDDKDQLAQFQAEKYLLSTMVIVQLEKNGCNQIKEYAAQELLHRSESLQSFRLDNIPYTPVAPQRLSLTRPRKDVSEGISKRSDARRAQWKHVPGLPSMVARDHISGRVATACAVQYREFLSSAQAWAYRSPRYPLINQYVSNPSVIVMDIDQTTEVIKMAANANPIFVAIANNPSDLPPSSMYGQELRATCTMGTGWIGYQRHLYIYGDTRLSDNYSFDVMTKQGHLPLPHTACSYSPSYQMLCRGILDGLRGYAVLMTRDAIPWGIALTIAGCLVSLDREQEEIVKLQRIINKYVAPGAQERWEDAVRWQRIENRCATQKNTL